MIYRKKAAIELSVSTIVVVVLAMTMLILGLVLVRSIFKTTTGSVGQIDQKIQQEIIGLFSDDGKNVVVRLGPDHTAKIKPSDDEFGLAIGARTKDGSATKRERLQYKLTLTQLNTESCAKKLGLAKTKSLFISVLDSYQPFNAYQDSESFALIKLKVPKGTPTCSQMVNVDVKDTSTNEDIGGDFFNIEIVK